MATRGVAFTAHIYAYDSATGAPKTGDSANITPRLVKDGTGAALTTATVTEVDATNLPGSYKVSISGTEADCDALVVGGKSSTSGVYIVPTVYQMERLPDAAPDAAGGVRDVARVAGTSQTARDLGAGVLVSDKTGFSLSSAGVQAIWDALSSALTTAGSIGKRIVDYLTGDAYARIGAGGAGLTAVPWNASWDAEVQSECDDALEARGYTSTVSARIDAAISSRGTGTALDASGVRAAVGLASANLDAQLAALAAFVDTEVAAILEDTGTSLPALIAALNNLSSAGAQAACAAALAAYDPPTRTEATSDKDELLTRLGAPANASLAADIAAVLVAVGQKATPAQVATEIADALRADSGTELSSPPAKDAPVAAQVQWLFQALRNGGTQTATARTTRNDAGSTTGTQTVSDDGTTLTVGKAS